MCIFALSFPSWVSRPIPRFRRSGAFKRAGTAAAVAAKTGGGGPTGDVGGEVGLQLGAQRRGPLLRQGRRRRPVASRAARFGEPPVHKAVAGRPLGPAAVLVRGLHALETITIVLLSKIF